MHDFIKVTPSVKVAKILQSRKVKLNSLYRTIGSIEGYNAEHRIVVAWRPRWHHRQRYRQVFKSVRKATSYEDNVLKYDVVFETSFSDMPEIGLQSKTNYESYVEFIKNYPEVPAVYINSSASLEMIRRYTLLAILQKYPEIIPKMKLLGCQISSELEKKLAEVGKCDKLMFV